MPAESNALAISKADEKQFQRGFKQWCENTALGIRRRLGLKEHEPLNPTLLAESMGVTILALHDVEGLDTATLSYLSSAEGDEWSAVTVHTGEAQIIIVNPRHSDARQASNIMHELAHIIRGHEPSKVYAYEQFALREFNVLQENEANWLAGCLLLPRKCLTYALWGNEDPDDSMSRLGVSKSLYNYRMNVSGVRRQFANSRR